MDLANIPNDTLLDEVKNLVGQEKKIIVQVIVYLKEIELRKLYLERGFSSMFAFATEFLGYSESEAHIRLQAARLTQSLPDVTSKIESGELNLSVAAYAQSKFRNEDLRRKSEGEKAMTRDEKHVTLELIAGCSRREAERKLSDHFVQQSEAGKEFKFQASTDLQEKLDHLLDYFAHQNYERDIGKLIELMADYCMKGIEKKYTSKARESQNSAQAEEGANLRATAVRSKPIPRSRFISIHVKRQVWMKSGGQCCYYDKVSGRRCSSRHALELDHIIPFSKGGASTADNLRLLCDAHNRWRGP